MLALVVAAIAFLATRRGGEGVASSKGVASTVDPERARHAAPQPPPVVPFPTKAAIDGRVVTEGEVTSAHVCLRCLSGACTTGAPPTCAATTAEGRFDFGALRPGTYRLSASAPGYLPAQYPEAELPPYPALTLAEGERRSDVTVHLRRGGLRISGVVRDATGGVISEAWIVAPNAEGAEAAARSGGDGRFVLHVALQRGVLAASAEGYSRSRRPYVAPAADSELVLAPASTIVGRVLDAGSREPLTGVVVRATKALGSVLSDSGEAKSEGDGAFRIESLSGGLYDVDLNDPRFALDAPVTAAVEVGAESAQLTLLASRTASVSGRISVAQRPCPAGRADALLSDGLRSYRATADDDGALRFDGVLPATYRADVFCPGARSLHEELVVPPAGRAGVQWNTEPGAVLRGSVRGSSGPIPGVDVSVGRSDPRQGGSAGTSCRSDDAGRFECPGLGPGRYRCRASARSGRASEPVTVTISAGADPPPVELTLPDRGALRVRVVDARGKPLEGVPVFVRDGGGKSFAGRVVGAGEHSVEDLAPGAYKAHSGLPTDPAGDGTAVQVRDGETSEVVLRADPPSAELRGVVVDENGEALPDVWVEATPQGAEGGPARRKAAVVLTGPDGVFLVAPVARGTYSIHAEHPLLGKASLFEARTGTPIRLSLPRPASVSGFVTTAEGSPATAFAVMAMGPGGGVRHFRSPDGSFTMHGLQPGDWTFSVSQGTGSASARLQIAAGQSIDGLRFALSTSSSEPASTMFPGVSP